MKQTPSKKRQEQTRRKIWLLLDEWGGRYESLVELKQAVAARVGVSVGTVYNVIREGRR